MYISQAQIYTLCHPVFPHPSKSPVINACQLERTYLSADTGQVTLPQVRVGMCSLVWSEQKTRTVLSIVQH